MKSKCNSQNHIIDYSSSCCMTHLILMFNKTENNHLLNPYGILLLKTLNQYINTSSSVLNDDIPIGQLLIFLEILTKYSCLYYFRGRNNYSKLLIKFGIDSVNQSKFKSQPEIIERKNALINNIACIYNQEGDYIRAAQFLDKLIETSNNYLDKFITYNNLGLIELKKKRIKEGIRFFNLIYKEIENKPEMNVPHSKKNKTEIIAVFLYNYCMVIKKYLNNDIDSIYEKSLQYSKTCLGENHPLTVKFIEYKNEDKDSFCSSDSSPEPIQDKEINFSKFANCKIKEMEEKEIKLVQEESKNESNVIKVEDKELIKNEHKVAISPEIPKKVTGTTLPFKKKKKNLKELFSIAFNANKPQPQSQVIFATIAKNLKEQQASTESKNSVLKKIEESTSKKITSTFSILNKYDDIMTKFEQSEKKVELMPFFNEQPYLESVNSKRALLEGKRVSVQFSSIQIENEAKQRSKSIFGTQNTKKGTTEIFKHLLSYKKGDINNHNPLLEQIDGFEVVDNLNNFYLIKYKNENNFDKELSQMIERSLDFTQIYESKRILSFGDNNINHKIIITNEDKNRLISISVNDLRSKEAKEIYNEKLSYGDLNQCLQSISFYTSMPQHCSLNFFSNVSVFIKNVLIKHCYMIPNNSNGLDLVLLPYQVSISRKSFIFNFLNTECFCSLIVDNQEIYLLVYSKENQSLVIRIDIFTDQSSFNAMFIESVEFGIKTVYYNDKNDYEKFFSKLFNQMQEIIKLNMNLTAKLDTITLKDAVEFYSKSVFKLDIQNKLNQKDFWLITKDPNEFQWKIDLYTMEKIEISNGSFYINKSIILDHEDFFNVIGSEPRDVLELMSDKDLIISHKLLLNSVKMRNIMLKILTEKNYDSMLRLMRIKPSCFFRFNFVLIQKKKYFCCSFEFIIYSKENFFLRLMLTEMITSRSYAKLYLPYLMNHQTSNVDALKKNLVEELKLSKELLNNKIRLRTVLVEESLGILTKNSNVVFYENIDIILNKLNKTEL